jgi:chromosome segregation ATPase
LVRPPSQLEVKDGLLRASEASVEEREARLLAAEERHTVDTAELRALLNELQQPDQRSLQLCLATKDALQRALDVEKQTTKDAEKHAAELRRELGASCEERTRAEVSAKDAQRRAEQLTLQLTAERAAAAESDKRSRASSSALSDATAVVERLLHRLGIAPSKLAAPVDETAAAKLGRVEAGVKALQAELHALTDEHTHTLDHLDKLQAPPNHPYSALRHFMLWPIPVVTAEARWHGRWITLGWSRRMRS